MNVQQLVINGKILKAIELLDDDFMITNLSMRFNVLEKNRMQGLISNSDYTTQRNRIVAAILDTAKDGINVPRFMESQKPAASIGSSELTTLHKKYKRRDTEFAAEIFSLIESFNSYATSKSTESGFDVRGRKLRALELKKNNIIEKAATLEGDNAESKVKKVMGLIADPIPSYEKLKEAWSISNGLGFRNSWIPEALNNQPNDDDVKILIAESIEDFVEVL